VISYKSRAIFYIIHFRWNSPIFPGQRLRPPDSAGSCRKGAEKTLDPAGKHRIYPEVETVFPSEIFWNFSGGFQSISCAFRQEPARIYRPGLIEHKYIDCLFKNIIKIELRKKKNHYSTGFVDYRITHLENSPMCDYDEFVLWIIHFPSK
jgi:hypothetical protein